MNIRHQNILVLLSWIFFPLKKLWPHTIPLKKTWIIPHFGNHLILGGKRPNWITTIFTVRKRSLGPGNVLHLSVCPQGEVLWCHLRYSTSRWYASYWNAFLLSFFSPKKCKQVSGFHLLSTRRINLSINMPKIFPQDYGQIHTELSETDSHRP